MKRVKLALPALEQAVQVACQNIPVAPGRTLILTDNSGSMRGDWGGKSALSAMSKRPTSDIANLFAAMYQSRAEDTVIGLFGDRLIIPKLDAADGVFQNFKNIEKWAAQVGGGTETGIFKMMERLIEGQVMVDRIVIFSDCQVGEGCGWFDTGRRHGNDFNKLFQTYRKLNPQVNTYSVDLRGYGNTLFDEGVATIAGWSEKIFDLMAAIDQGRTAIEEINKIQL